MARAMWHVVITRFNVRTSITGDTPVTSAAWLTPRFELFERFCLPSMQAQQAAHEWLVWFDAETPSEMRAKVDGYAGVTPIWSRGFLDDDRLLDELAARVPPDATHVISTRLDNDDAVATDYLMRVQEAWRDEEDDVFLNFPFGYQLQDGRLYHSLQRANPFFSHVERVDRSRPGLGLQSVAGLNHDALGRTGRLRQVASRAAWVQVVHGGNVANELRGVRRVSQHHPRGFTDLRLRDEALRGRLAGVVRSSGNLLALPWQKRSRIAARVRDRLRKVRASRDAV